MASLLNLGRERVSFEGHCHREPLSLLIQLPRTCNNKFKDDQIPVDSHKNSLDNRHLDTCSIGEPRDSLEFRIDFKNLRVDEVD